MVLHGWISGRRRERADLRYDGQLGVRVVRGRRRVLPRALRQWLVARGAAFVVICMFVGSSARGRRVGSCPSLGPSRSGALAPLLRSARLRPLPPTRPRYPRPFGSNGPPRVSPAKLGARAIGQQQATTTRPPATRRVRRTRPPTAALQGRTNAPAPRGGPPGSAERRWTRPTRCSDRPGGARCPPVRSRSSEASAPEREGPSDRPRASRRPRAEDAKDMQITTNAAQRTTRHWRSARGSVRGDAGPHPKRREYTNGPGRQATEPVRVCSGRGAWGLSTSRPFHRPAYHHHHHRPARPPECPPPPLRW